LTFRIQFGKTIKVTGKIESYPDEEPYLGILNRTENNIKLISIQLGNNGMNFAILTDEMNGNVYDYGSSVLSNLEHKNIQEIVEAVDYKFCYGKIVIKGKIGDKITHIFLV